MENQPRHGRPFEPVVKMHSPRVYGSFPTLFGTPLAETKGDLRRADVAFLGVPWRAPTTPSSFFIGGARTNFEGIQLTPSYFRLNSLNYEGYLPELDLDVFEHLRLVDRGDVDIFQDIRTTFSAVEAEVGAKGAACGRRVAVLHEMGKYNPCRHCYNPQPSWKPWLFVGSPVRSSLG